MSQGLERPSRLSRFLVVAALALCGGLCGRAPMAWADAVDDLGAALKVRPGELVTLDPELRDKILAQREKRVQAQIDALRSIGDLRRALSLQDWNDDPTRDLGEAFRKLDAKLRRTIGDRLTAAVRRVVKSGDANSRLAAANLIAEMGPDVRSTTEGDRKGFARGLTGEAIQLAGDSNLAVSQEGLRALGNIFPKEDEAAAVFRKTLKGGALGQRRLAGDGLVQMVKVVNHLQKKTTSTSGVTASRSDLLKTILAAVGAADAGMEDSDAEVRESCLLTVAAAAAALVDLVPDGSRILGELPKGAGDLRELEPQLKLLREQRPYLVAALQQPSERVKLAGLDALENIALVRLRMKRLALSLSPPDGEKQDDEIRSAVSANDPLGEFVRKDLGLVADLLADPHVRVRQNAVEVLDTLEISATPAIPALAKSLEDENRFVRWAAARAIGNINPNKAEVAVPGLAKLLADNDLSVRSAASMTLRLLGQAALPAAAALAQSAADGDVDSRLEAMETLQGLGAAAAKNAVPALVEVLTHRDPRARRGAARTLGSFGPAAAPAIPALRRTLGDDDPEVRSSASDAMLSILAPLPKE